MKNKEFWKGAVAGALVVTCIGTGVFAGTGLAAKGTALGDRKCTSKLAYLEELIDRYYLGDKDEEKLQEGLYAGLPVIFLVTFGGFLTNAIYCLQQNVTNKSMNDYAKGKVWSNNLVFCALAGVLWYMQFFGLEMGKSFLAESPVLLAFSWCILMALNVTFSNVWGIILKEWKGVSAKTITVLVCGLLVLIFSLVFPNLF